MVIVVHPLERHLAALRDGATTHVLVDREEVSTDVARPAVVVPGSFDPVHAGHLRLAAAATEAVAAAGLGVRRAVFELSLRNVDKPALGVAEVLRRLASLRAHGPVLVTGAATFDRKARIVPGAVFAVGHDTATRLVDPAYYDDDTARDRALAVIAAAGCRVAVAGRSLDGGPYRDLDDVPVPAPFGRIFLPVPGVRVDVSSTRLRAAREAGRAGETRDG